MRLDLVRRLTASHRPTVLPIAWWLYPPLFEPQLQRLSDNDRPGPVSRCRNINDRDKLPRKRHVDLAEILIRHAMTVPHRPRQLNPPVPEDEHEGIGAIKTASG